MVNADDLGRDEAATRAILEAFGAGLISNASIMANMAGYASACEMALEAGLADRVSVHLNLTQGTPLTVPIRSVARFCDEAGDFRRSAGVSWYLARADVVAVEMELDAQVRAVLDAGIKPNQLDSHHGSHTHWPIGAIVIRLAKRYQVPAVRLIRNCGPSSSGLTRVYKRLFNARLERAGLARVTWFGSAPDVMTIRSPMGTAELMVHPEFDPEGVIVDCLDGASRFDTAEPLAGVVGRVLDAGWHMSSFAELSA